MASLQLGVVTICQIATEAAEHGFLIGQYVGWFRGEVIQKTTSGKARDDTWDMAGHVWLGMGDQMWGATGYDLVGGGYSTLISDSCTRCIFELYICLNSLW